MKNFIEAKCPKLPNTNTDNHICITRTTTLWKKLSASQMPLVDKNIQRPFFHNCG